MTLNKSNVAVNTTEIKSDVGKSIGKAQMGQVDTPFDTVLGMASALEPVAGEVTNQAVGPDAASVLHGAFTGTYNAAGSFGYGAPGTAAAGFGTSTLSEYPGMMGYGSSSTAFAGKGIETATTTTAGSAAGTGLPTGELINAMNTNNLKLLELQAVMQSNMQQWNTKSNILQADHRSRMAMIEKFSPR